MPYKFVNLKTGKVSGARPTRILVLGIRRAVEAHASLYFDRPSARDEL